MSVTSKRAINFLKALLSGVIGAAIFLMLSIFALAIVKLVYTLLNRDLLLGKYNLLTVVALFIFFGFAFGMSCFLRKNSYQKTFKLSWANFLIDFILSLAFAFSIYLMLKFYLDIVLGIKALAALGILLFIVFYAFSALFAHYLVPKRERMRGHKLRNAVLLILFNPIFIIFYLWLFAIVSYNSVYVPCGVIISGVEKNIYTANTQNLGINQGERIISIDNVPINSVQDVKRFMSSLPSTKEVIVETDNRIYYIRTYRTDDSRFMGLLLRQAFCVKEY